MKSERNAAQLRLIQEVTQLLSGAGVEHWLWGGWAVDFLIGEVTRPHEDVEFVIWCRDMPKIRQILVENGYREQAVPYPDEGAAFSKYGERVGPTFIEENEQGEIVTPGRWRDWPWAEGSFSAGITHLGQIACPVVSAQAQLDTKENFPRHLAGRPLREKDRADIALLRSLVARRRSTQVQLER